MIKSSGNDLLIFLIGYGPCGIAKEKRQKNENYAFGGRAASIKINQMIGSGHMKNGFLVRHVLLHPQRRFAIIRFVLERIEIQRFNNGNNDYRLF